MAVFSYLCRGGVDLDEQRKCVEHYISRMIAAPAGSGSTFREPPGVFVDRTTPATKLRLSRRPEGGRLFNLARLGDHVVFSSPRAAFRSFRDWQESTAKLCEYGVTLHFAMTSQVIKPGDPLLPVAAQFGWLAGELIGHRRRLRCAADAAGIRVLPRLRASRLPIEVLEEFTRGGCGLGGRIFPYVRTSLDASAWGEVGFFEQEKSVRSLGKMLARIRGDLSVESTKLDNSLRTVGFRFMDCPRGAEILRSIGRRDIVIVHSVPAAFRSMADLLATDWFLRVRGASLVVVEENLDTSTGAGRRTMDAFAWLERLSWSWKLKTLRGDRTPRRPTYVSKVDIRGKRIYPIDRDLLRLVRSVRTFATSGVSARKIAIRLEKLDSARFADGIAIPAGGMCLNSAAAKAIHPGHGVRMKTRIRRRWTLEECERMRSQLYWVELEDLACEQGIRRSPRVS